MLRNMKKNFTSHCRPSERPAALLPGAVSLLGSTFEPEGLQVPRAPVSRAPAPCADGCRPGAPLERKDRAAPPAPQGGSVSLRPGTRVLGDRWCPGSSSGSSSSHSERGPQTPAPKLLPSVSSVPASLPARPPQPPPAL